MTKPIIYCILILSVILVGSAPAAAQSILIPVEGTVTDADGEPITSDALTITFRLYDAEEGGLTLHEEPIVTATEEGRFAVYLGESQAIFARLFLSNPELWLSLQVNQDPEATPRIPLGTVPYAAAANYCADAETVGGLTGAELVSMYSRPNNAETRCVSGEYLDGDGVCRNLRASVENIAFNRFQLESVLEGSFAPANTPVGTQGEGELTIDTTSYSSVASIQVPGRAVGGVVFNAHAYAQQRGSVSTWHYFAIRRDSCAGTIVGETIWRTGVASSTWQGESVSLTGFDSSVTTDTTYHLCARAFDADLEFFVFQWGLTAH